MQSLRECIAEAKARKVALGHFNVSDSEQLSAIVTAAKNLNLPVVVGVSEGERDFFGVHQVAALVRTYREQMNLPVYLNADHSYSVARVKEAIDAGFDAVIFDGTKQSFEENVAQTKECVQYARSCGRDVLIEGELGFIGTSSKILDEVPQGAAITEEHLTKPEEAQRFVEATGVDLLAPAVGSLHGMLRSGKNPGLFISRIKEIAEASPAPLVLHGGSGTEEEDFVAAISAGVAIIHINTEIRVAYRKGIQLSLQEDPEEIAPYKFMRGGVTAVEKVVSERLKLFNNF